MTQKTAWHETVNALRLRFLQGNSHIEGIDEMIDKWIVETLQKIRDTAPIRATETFVAKIPIDR